MYIINTVDWVAADYVDLQMHGMGNFKLYYEMSRRIIISELIQNHAIKKEINGKRKNNK